MNRSIRSLDDVLEMMDHLFADRADRWTDRGGADWWDQFYADRARGVPFFVDAPDESLVGWHHDGLVVLDGARVLELGCGPGRNAVWMARHGASVDALDLSGTAIEWGRERAAEAAVDVNFVRADIFAWPGLRDDYDLVYDSGCFHHLPPHRRLSYRTLLESTLRPGGLFALACFAAGAMGAEVPDRDLYLSGSLAGGLAYSAQELRHIFDWLDERDLRRMDARTAQEDTFGQEFLWAGLFERRA